jgi:hypothetical protein
LNDIVWRAFTDPEFRREFYSRKPADVLRSVGIPEDQIEAFVAQDIRKLAEFGLVARGPLRWGTFWLNLLSDRAKRGKKFTVEDLLRLQDS